MTSFFSIFRASRAFALLVLGLLSLDLIAEPLFKQNSSITSATPVFSTLPTKPAILGSVQEIKSTNISSDYGRRISPFSGLHENHDGLDIPAQFGSPILSAGKGTVVFAAYAPGYGNLIEIYHGQGVITRYGHADRLLVKAGEPIEESQQIATVGSTGRSTGPHLHFEVSKAGLSIDPKLLFFIEGKKSGTDLQRYTFIFKEMKLRAPKQMLNMQANQKQQIVYASTATTKSGEPLVIVRTPTGKVRQ